MEGFQWIRIGTIVALFAGAIYILLPTIFQQDSEELLGQKADSVQTTGVAPDLKLRFTVSNGAVEDALEVVKMRLDTHEGVERVQQEDNLIVIITRVGYEPDAIAAELNESHVVSVHPLAGVLPEGEETLGLEDLSTAESVLGLASIDAPATPFGLAEYNGLGQGTLSATPTENPGPLAVAVNGTVSAVATVKTDESGMLTNQVDVVGLEGRASISNALAKPGIPGGLSRVEKTEDVGLQALQTDEEEAEK